MYPSVWSAEVHSACSLFCYLVMISFGEYLMAQISELRKTFAEKTLKVRDAHNYFFLNRKAFNRLVYRVLSVRGMAFFGTFRGRGMPDFNKDLTNLAGKLRGLFYLRPGLVAIILKVTEPLIHSAAKAAYEV